MGPIARTSISLSVSTLSTYDGNNYGVMVDIHQKAIPTLLWVVAGYYNSPDGCSTFYNDLQPVWVITVQTAANLPLGCILLHSTMFGYEYYHK